MAPKVYDKFKNLLTIAGVNWTSAALKVLLEDSTSTYTPDDAHNFVANFLGNGGVEYGAGSGTAYARKALGTLAATRVDGSHQMQLHAADVTWAALNGLTLRGALIFVDSGSDATSPLVAYIDTGGFPLVTNGGDVTLHWSASGIITLT